VAMRTACRRSWWIERIRSIAGMPKRERSEIGGGAGFLPRAFTRGRCSGKTCKGRSRIVTLTQAARTR
jgi:hypothetical protein